MIDTPKDWYAIVNPHAGSGKTMSEWELAGDTLAKLNVPYKATLTTHKYHATKLAYEAALHGYRRLIAVGGDGSLHEVISGMLQFCDESGTDPSEFYLAVIPIGSGNDWIKSTKVPHDTKRVCELIAAGSFSQQDVFRVETSAGTCYMGNIGGVGFDAHVCERVNAQKERGKRSELIYVAGLLYSLIHAKPFGVKLEIDGRKVYEGGIYTMAVGNGSYSGGGMRQVPEAEMNDGLIDWMIVPKQPLLGLIPIIPKLFNGTFTDSPKVFHGRCRSFRLDMTENADPELVESDGEVIGRLPLRVTATGKKLNILVGAPDD